MNWLSIGLLVYAELRFIVGLGVSRGIASECDCPTRDRTLDTALVVFPMFTTRFRPEGCISVEGANCPIDLAVAAFERAKPSAA